MTKTAYTTLATPDLREGVIVNCHGLRCLIDREMKLSKVHAGGQTFWTEALVLNRDEVSSDCVPYGYTAPRNVWDGSRWVKPTAEHRWTIQGNELAQWVVEA